MSDYVVRRRIAIHMSVRDQNVRWYHRWDVLLRLIFGPIYSMISWLRCSEIPAKTKAREVVMLPVKLFRFLACFDDEVALLDHRIGR